MTVELYPDLKELDPDERCTVPGMTIGGKQAYLFSSRNQKTVSRHVRWMQEYGLDGVLVQRFVGSIRGKRADGEVVLKNIMTAAKESGRTFAIEYDISGGNADTFAQTLKNDWMYLVDELKITSHPNYQRHNGRTGNWQATACLPDRRKTNTLYFVGIILSAQTARVKQPVDYVNPNIGTIGHLLTATTPYVQYPHGMARVAPVTTPGTQPGTQDRYLADKILRLPGGSGDSDGVHCMPRYCPSASSNKAGASML